MWTAPPAAPVLHVFVSASFDSTSPSSRRHVERPPALGPHSTMNTVTGTACSASTYMRTAPPAAPVLHMFVSASFDSTSPSSRRHVERSPALGPYDTMNTFTSTACSASTYMLTAPPAAPVLHMFVSPSFDSTSPSSRRHVECSPALGPCPTMNTVTGTACSTSSFTHLIMERNKANTVEKGRKRIERGGGGVVDREGATQRPYATPHPLTLISLKGCQISLWSTTSLRQTHANTCEAHTVPRTLVPKTHTQDPPTLTHQTHTVSS